jgi:hypothetical protein
MSSPFDRSFDDDKGTDQPEVTVPALRVFNVMLTPVHPEYEEDFDDALDKSVIVSHGVEAHTVLVSEGSLMFVRYQRVGSQSLIQQVCKIFASGTWADVTDVSDAFRGTVAH